MVLDVAGSMGSRLKRITPIQKISIGFLFIVAVATSILTLPVSTANGNFQSFLDALFTITSAISTTGLVVVDTGSYYSIFGQIIILIVVQIGGLGYMSIVVYLYFVAGKRPSLTVGMTLRESLSGVSLRNFREFARIVIIYTIFFESVGAIVLAFYWMDTYPIGRSIYLGVFHSISAFCTAGFGLFSDSLMSDKNSVILNGTIDILCIVGGLGFFVLHDVRDRFRRTEKYAPKRRLSTHTKVVLFTSAILMIAGSVLIFMSERGAEALPIADRFLYSTFQAISASTTTGFNTIDIAAMKSAGLFTIIVLMFIGASPGSTAGGIKTTTFGVIFCSTFAVLRNKETINTFDKQVSAEVAKKSFAIMSLALFLVAGATQVLTLTENATFMQVLFEVVSAFGNVGLSTGITAGLTPIGKIVIIITMFIGRVGPWGIGLSLIGRVKPDGYTYPEAEIFVG
jgi:trk system potassium uptake protein TrkH